VIDVSLDPFVIPAEDQGERSTNERGRPADRRRLDPETLGERGRRQQPGVGGPVGVVERGRER
jgi:hypothetical protein